MKYLIKKILLEEFLSKIDNWIENFQILNNGEVVTTLISEDDVTGENLRLFVGFTEYNINIMEYSYSFILLDKNNKPLTNLLTKREEVSKYIPNDIKNKKQIITIIMEMTRKLLEQKLPKEIIRRTVENLSGNSLIRYEEITNIMINEYGYKLVETKTDPQGKYIWILSKVIDNEKNHGMVENYEINSDLISQEEMTKRWEDKIIGLLPRLKK